MMLLTDTRLLENLKVISESKERNTMKIRGIFQRADEINANKRIYPKSILEKHVSDMQKAIRENRLCGELDHPAYNVVKLSNASHKITRLEMVGSEVIGEAEILGTPAGMVAQALIRGGVAVGISSRGSGKLSEAAKDGASIVEEFEGVTYDLVADPSTRGAFPSLTEGKEDKQKEYIMSVMNKVLGEKVLIQLIENRLAELNKNLVTETKVETPKPVDVQKAASSLQAKLEEVAQSIKTIKLARAKRKALANRGFGDKKSTLQKAKDDANPEHQAKVKSERMGMLKSVLQKRQDNKKLANDAAQESKNSTEKGEDKTFSIMEMFKAFGGKNRYALAADAKKSPDSSDKRVGKATKILKKLADRNTKKGFKGVKKDDFLGYQ